MKTQLRPGEQVVKQSLGNMKRGLQNIGGKLYLTTQRVIFEPHVFNIHSTIIAIELGQISSATATWTTLLGVPLVPNAVQVESPTGQACRFAVFNRQQWAGAIEWQRNALGGQT